MKLPFQPRLARNQGSGLELSPTHASLRSLTAIMITTSNSPARRSGMPYQLLGVLLHTMAISGLSRVRAELFNCSQSHPLNLAMLSCRNSSLSFCVVSESLFFG